MLPILIHIQANLDGDLSLARLAGLAGRSPSHFHRMFHRRVGETPRRYVERLRLEQAVVRLLLLRTTVLEVALAMGFQSHETFTRAFRRRFGVLPGRVRKDGFGALGMETPRRGEGGLDEAEAEAGTAGGYTLSATRLVEVEPWHLAFLRQVGPYEEVGNELFEALRAWARWRLGGYRPLMGIGHDAPGITPPEKLRFDAAIQVDGPFAAEDGVAYQRLELGRCAVTTHVGSYATLPHAYGALFGRISALPDVRPRGVPAVEIYHERRIDVSLRYNHTDIYLPVVPRARSSARR